MSIDIEAINKGQFCLEENVRSANRRVLGNAHFRCPQCTSTMACTLNKRAFVRPMSIHGTACSLQCSPQTNGTQLPESCHYVAIFSVVKHFMVYKTMDVHTTLSGPVLDEATKCFVNRRELIWKHTFWMIQRISACTLIRWHFVRPMLIHVAHNAHRIQTTHMST